MGLTLANAEFSVTAADYIEKRLDEAKYKLQAADKLEEAKLLESMQQEIILEHDLISLRKGKDRKAKKEEKEKERKRKFTASLYFAGLLFLIGLFTIGKDVFVVAAAIAFYTFLLLSILVVFLTLIYVFWEGLLRKWSITNRLLENIKKIDVPLSGREKKKVIKNDVIGRERREDNMRRIAAIVLFLVFIIATILWYR